MTPEQLRAISIELFGETGWQSALADHLEVDGSTVRRWLSGTIPVPGPVAAAVRCMQRCQCRKRKARA